MRFFRENNPEKVLALLLALFLWTAARGRQDLVDARWDAPLQWRNLPAGLAAVRGPEKVRFVVQGTRQDCRRLERTLKPYVDLSSAQPGLQGFEIFYQLSGALSVKEIEVFPPRAQFEFDQVIERSVPVEVRVRGSVPEGFSLAGKSATPDEVTVRGRKAVVSRLSTAVATVDIGEPASPVRSAGVQLLDAGGHLVRELKPKPTQVRVQLKFTEQESTIAVLVRQRTRGQIRGGGKLVAIQIRPERVTLTARSDLLREIREVETEPLELSGISESTSRTVRLVIPEGVRATPATVSARIIVEPPPAPPRETTPETSADKPSESAGKAKGKAPTDKGPTPTPTRDAGEDRDARPEGN